MDSTIRDLSAEELEAVSGGDVQHGLGSGEDICQRWFENGNGVPCLIIFGGCGALWL